MAKAPTDAAFVITAAGVAGFAVLCATGIVPTAVLASATGGLGASVLAGVIANALSAAARCTPSRLRSSTSLGKNNDLVRLTADAAYHCARTVTERRPRWKVCCWGERRALGRAARRLREQWANVDASSLGETCRSERVVDWFRQSMTDAAGIPAPLDLHQWRNLVYNACDGKLATKLRDELAAELHAKFTRWVRERFKADAMGDTPAKGRAYAALQMALLGGLYEAITQVADSSERTRVGVDQLTKAVEDIRRRVDDIAKAHPDLSELANQLRQSEARLLEAIGANHAPLITLPKPDPEGPRFVFRTERLTLVGREAELAELNGWLDEERPFSWDLWTGPAGSGKSRLALRLCRERTKEGWRAGFYDHQSDHPVRWDNWDPARDTLIVFDYVHERADKIGAALRTLAGRSWPKGRRVRVLLLEREIARPPDAPKEDVPTKVTQALPGWFDELIREGKQNPAPFRETHARQDIERPERPIAGVDDDALAAMVREETRLATDGTPAVIEDDEVAKRINIIKQIDPRARPLFAAMAAEAIRENTATDATLAKWDVRELVDYIRDKEHTRWTKALKGHGVSESAAIARWERFACLATMCGGLIGDARRKALTHSNAGLPNREDWRNGETYRLLIAGGSNDEAAPLEPDVLGEAYVLDWLGDDPDFAKGLVDLAWQVGSGSGQGASGRAGGAGFAGFLTRAAQNFPDHPMVDQLLAPISVADPRALANAHLARTLRPFLAGDLTKLAARGRTLLLAPEQPPLVRTLGALMWTQGPFSAEALDELLDEVGPLNNQHTEDAAVRELLAQGLANAIAHAGADHDRADRLLDELRTLQQQHAEDAAVREQLAKGLNNVIFHARADHDRADRLLDKLRTLQQQYAEDAAVREPLAKGLNNAIAHAGADHDRADRLLDELRTLDQRYADDAAVRRQLANGLFNAFNNAGADHDRADRLLDELRALQQQHAEDAAVRERLAKGLTNAIAPAGADHDRADRLLKELRTLQQQHAEDVAVRELLAKGLNNAIADAGADHDRADRLLDELRTLQQQHAEDVAVRELLAKGLNNAIADAGADHDRADRLLDELRTLQQQHAEDAAVRELLAKRLFNAFVRAGTDQARADRLLDELRTLQQQHAEDAAVRERLAKGLTNAIARAGADPARADRLLDELRTLHRRYADDAAVREELAWGLFNALHHAGADRARADRLLEELHTLHQRYADDAAIRQILARGLFNAFHNAGANHDRADRPLDGLRTLQRQHADDTAVREELAKGLSNAIAHAGADHARADRLLDELRTLHQRYADDAAVREQLANGLTNAVAEAGADHDRADRLLEELLALAAAQQNDSGLQAIGFRACGAGFVGGLPHGVIRVHVLEVAAEMLERCPATEKVRRLAEILLDDVQEVLKRVPPGDEYKTVDEVGAKLRSAYRARFPG